MGERMVSRSSCPCAESSTAFAAVMRAAASLTASERAPSMATFSVTSAFCCWTRAWSSANLASNICCSEISLRSSRGLNRATTESAFCTDALASSIANSKSFRSSSRGNAFKSRSEASRPSRVIFFSRKFASATVASSSTMGSPALTVWPGLARIFATRPSTADARRSGLVERCFASAQAHNHPGHGPQFNGLHANRDGVRQLGVFALRVARRAAPAPATARDSKQDAEKQEQDAVQDRTT